MDHYEDSDVEVDNNSDSDYELPQVLNAREAVMLFTGAMLTRSMRMAMLNRMG